MSITIIMIMITTSMTMNMIITTMSIITIMTTIMNMARTAPRLP